MQDNYGRNINYVRISVTDKCNLRCIYCMPADGIAAKSHLDILRYEEILAFARVATAMGITHFRITGGEPLVRKDLIPFIFALNQIPGVEDIAITTNGLLLTEYLAQLKAAGLRRVNISLDTLNPHVFRAMTRGGDVIRVMRAIEAAITAELHPVKINAVIIRGVNDTEITELARLALRLPVHVRFIELMPIGASQHWRVNAFVPAAEIKNAVERELTLLPAAFIPGNGPARYFAVQGGLGTVGFITPISDHFCHDCNRLRLTADGKLRSCLYSNAEIDIKAALNNGADQAALCGLIAAAVRAKPRRHEFATPNGTIQARPMFQIGG